MDMPMELKLNFKNPKLAVMPMLMPLVIDANEYCLVDVFGS